MISAKYEETRRLKAAKTLINHYSTTELQIQSGFGSKERENKQRSNKRRDRYKLTRASWDQTNVRLLTRLRGVRIER